MTLYCRLVTYSVTFFGNQKFNFVPLSRVKCRVDRQNIGNTRHCRNRTVRIGCTEKTLVVSIFHYSFVCLRCVVTVFMHYSLYGSNANWETCQTFKEDRLLVHI